PALLEGGQRSSEARRLEASSVLHEVVGVQRVEHLPEAGHATRAEPHDLAEANIHGALAVAPARVTRLRPVLERVGIELEPRRDAVRRSAAVNGDPRDLQ